MEEGDLLPTSAKPSASAFFGKGRYKFWALAAIILLAFWSMFTGTVTLKWSAVNLNRLSEDLFDPPLRDADLDVLV
ncbi:putative Lanosterol synthase [Cocos nucifera]|nr:putative Lanosterol synthase [Cocos nucifera]